ncbi:MAG: TrbC/VirB2 family protein [bacterium]|nr:TrbC/VirB2 family protein [bacterium]
MPDRFAKHLTLLFLLCVCLLHAPSLFAGNTSSLANFTGPIQTVIDWLTGDIGRLVSIVVLAFFGMYLWKKRAEDKGERGFFYLLGTAIVLGATNIVDALGFVGATY